CSFDGAAFAACTVGSVTATQQAAGLHTLAVNATDHWANTRFADGPDSHPEVKFTPNAGRLILIGHDFEKFNDDTVAIGLAALGELPWRKNAVLPVTPYTRPVHVAVFNPAAATAGEAASAAMLIASIPAPGITVTTFTDPNALATALLGNDILFVPDQNDTNS